MSTQKVDQAFSRKMLRSPNPSWRQRNRRALTLALLIGAFSFGVGGCVSDGVVGVSAYPNYASYYGDYGYGGAPYLGYGGIYTRNVVVRGRRHSGGYGRHHFARQRRGGDRPRFSRSGGMRRNPGIRGNRGGRGGRR